MLISWVCHAHAVTWNLTGQALFWHNLQVTPEQRRWKFMGSSVAWHEAAGKATNTSNEFLIPRTTPANHVDPYLAILSV